MSTTTLTFSEDLFEDQQPEQEDQRIFLKFNSQYGKKRCSLTGKPFESWWTLGFFLDNDFKQPVSQSEALEHGFTMSFEDFQKLCDHEDLFRNYIKKGRKLPEKERIIW